MNEHDEGRDDATREQDAIPTMPLPPLEERQAVLASVKPMTVPAVDIVPANEEAHDAVEDSVEETASEVVPAASSPSPEVVEQAERAYAFTGALEVIERLRARLRQQVIGRDEVIDLVLVALLADGHVLLEDFPGSGKTTLAKTLGGSIIDDRGGDQGDPIAAFRRIQFTPDLLPSDVTGVSVFDASTNRFHFRHGPIFAHVVLADEINRTSPKVQAAMLEAMAEKQVTVDNVTHDLDELFFVIATQNPLDVAGTYPLPSPQLDRFLFKIRMDHIDRASELNVLDTYRSRRDVERQDLPRVRRTDVIAARRSIEEGVTLADPVKACLVDLSRNLRADERVVQGNSTRSLVLMLPALQAMAAVRGRAWVSSDDIETLAPQVLAHRVELAPGITDFTEILRDAMAAPLDALAKGTLAR
ncbi:MAG: AAA family ATPase [Acidobacteriota bacterium]